MKIAPWIGVAITTVSGVLIAHGSMGLGVPALTAVAIGLWVACETAAIRSATTACR